MILAAILNLGNIQFESLTDDDSCNVTTASHIYLCNAAALLGVDERELTDGLTSLTLEMGDHRIKYIFNPPNLRDAMLNNLLILFFINLRILDLL